MKELRLITHTLVCFAVSLSMSACSDSDEEPESGSSNNDKEKPSWHLEWKEDFDTPELNDEVWSKTDRGTPDWQNTQSKDERCFDHRDGKIILRGIVNDDLTADPSRYLTGGIWTKGKKGFGPGCIQVRARLGEGAKGAWPAIWMMPYNESEGWPECGEIDIMERLNHEPYAYQTLHSHYITNLGKTDPVNSKSSYIDPNEFHIFEVQIWDDEVKFYIDNTLTLSYPKVNNGANGQFPFAKEWYLIIDMQLGGSWVGDVDGDELPVEMEVDWVKYFRYY